MSSTITSDKTVAKSKSSLGRSIAGKNQLTCARCPEPCKSECITLGMAPNIASFHPASTVSRLARLGEGFRSQESHASSLSLSAPPSYPLVHNYRIPFKHLIYFIILTIMHSGFHD